MKTIKMITGRDKVEEADVRKVIADSIRAEDEEE